MSIMSIRVPKDLLTDIKAISREFQMPVSEIVREAIRRFVLVHRYNRIRAKAVPRAAAMGFLTDEDVFRAVS